MAAWERPAAIELSRLLLREIVLLFTFCYEAEVEIPQLLKLIARGDIKVAPDDHQ